jgi:hypothetical protein
MPRTVSRPALAALFVIASAASLRAQCDPGGLCATLVPLPPLGRVPITITTGTLNCGGPAMVPPATAPFAGQLNAAGGAKLADLGRGCLYFGSGQNTSIPGGRLPDGAKLVLNVAGLNLLSAVIGPSEGSGPYDCTLPALATRHCVNGSTGTDGAGACTTDAHCGVGAAPGSCARDARCFFGPPLPISVPSFPPASTCVVNAFQDGACGELNLLTQAVSFKTGVSARAYLGASVTAPCPRCIGNVCQGGANDGGACTPIGSAQTSVDCLPPDSAFVGALAVTIDSGTTGTTALSAADGNFCAGQATPGAFGFMDARAIVTRGAPLNPLGLLSSQALMTVASPFCIPATGSLLIDTVGGLPGPGAFSVSTRLELADLLRLGLPL